MVRANVSTLKQGKWYEYALRFLLGGLSTVLAGLVASYYGPAIGGLFLAFPAIFCCTATLIESHERKRKQEHGLSGKRRGRQAAALDAAGAGWGSIALAAFAFCVWSLAPHRPAAALVGASLVWLLVAVLMWFLRKQLRRAYL